MDWEKVIVETVRRIVVKPILAFIAYRFWWRNNKNFVQIWGLKNVLSQQRTVAAANRRSGVPSVSLINYHLFYTLHNSRIAQCP